MNNLNLPLVIIGLILLCIVGTGLQCTFRPALINWERRDEPLLPWRRKPKPAEPVTKGEMPE